MSATAISICSNALLRLGSDPINSFDEGDSSGSNLDSARLASNLWPTVRRQVLRGHIWNCALRRVLLSPDTIAPAFGWSYRFLRPADWVRNVHVGLNREEKIAFASEDIYYLSDEASLPLTYIYDNDNPATYDAALVAALELSMAAAMAYPITKSTSLASELQALARDMLGDARTLDGQDDPPEMLGDSMLVASRYGARTGGG